MSLYDQTVLFWKSSEVNTKEQLDQRLDSFRILFAYNSGKIENMEVTFHETKEIFMLGRVTNGFSGLRTLLEQQNQKLCYELLKCKIIKREPLSIDLILDIHQTLMGGIYGERTYVENGERPGSFKKHDYITGVHEVGSTAKDAESDIKKLLDEVNSYDGEEVLKTAAYLHAKFEFIHPFADGNGRVGRSLMNYFLMLHRHPPLIIYFEDKRRYYESLVRYDEAEDLNPLYEFLKFEAGKTWEKAINPHEDQKAGRKSLMDFTEEIFKNRF